MASDCQPPANRSGTITVEGVTRPAHVVAWEREYGSPPAGRIFRRCETPGCTNGRHYSTVRSGRDETASDALNIALRRAGRGIEEACEEAEVSRIALSRALAGGGERRAYRDVIERLAAVLDAPELLAEIPTWPREHVLICRACGEEARFSRNDLLARVRAAAKREAAQESGFDKAAIDWERGRGSFTCGSCVHSKNWRERWFHSRVKVPRQREGKRYHQRRAAELRARRTPEQAIEAQRQATAAARDRVRSDDEKVRHSRSMVSPRPAGTFSLCVACELLIFTRRSSPAGRGVVHRACKRELLPERPPRRPGAPPWHEKPRALDDAFAMAVRHLLRGEEVGARDGRGLAAEFGLDASTVWRRIRFIIERFPPDSRASRDICRWRDLILPLWLERASSRP